MNILQSHTIGFLLALLSCLGGAAQTEDHYELSPRARTSTRNWAVFWEASGLVTGKAAFGIVYETGSGALIYGKGMLLLPYFKTGFLLSDLAYDIPVELNDGSGFGVSIGYRALIDPNTLGAQKGFGAEIGVIRAQHSAGTTTIIQMNPHYYLQKPIAERWYVEMEAGFALAAYTFPGPDFQNLFAESYDNTKFWINPTFRVSLGWLL
jgi:hypothetical protein